jgi:lipopolysaccharide/colanic/teichoic acid biosynthesis glycosyltransferase
MRQKIADMMKRLFDLVAAAGGLAVFSPVMIWSSWRIKQEDGGPVFYRGAQLRA